MKKINDLIKEYIEHIQLFSNNARLYLISGFLLGMSFSGFRLLFNLFMKELEFSETIIGYRLSIFSLGSLLIAIPATLSAKKRHFNKLFMVSVIFLFITWLLQIFFTELIPLFSATLIGGMFMTYYQVAVAPFIMRNSTRKERTHLFSLNFAIMLLAGIFGNIISGYLPALFKALEFSTIQSFRGALVVTSGFSLLSFLFIPRVHEKDRQLESRITIKDIFKIENPGLLFRIVLPSVIVGMGAGLIIPFMNLYFRNRINLPVGSIGIIFSISQVFMFLGILLGPPLSKKFGKIKTVVITQFLSIPFMLILAFMHQYLLVAIAFCIRAALMNMAQPLTTNFAMELVPKNEHEITNSALMVSWTASWTISTAIGGRLIEMTGFTIPLLIAAGLYIISSILYSIFFLKMEKTIESLEWSGN